MDCPPRLIAIAQAFLTQNPALTTGTDDQSRLFLRLVAEQAAFELGPAYGLKSAGDRRPPGPSPVASPGDTQFGGWRIIDADASVTGQRGGIIPNPPWQTFPGQLFLSVDPVDHLRVSDTRAPPRADAPPAPVDLRPILARLGMLGGTVSALA